MTSRIRCSSLRGSNQIMRRLCLLSASNTFGHVQENQVSPSTSGPIELSSYCLKKHKASKAKMLFGQTGNGFWKKFLYWVASSAGTQKKHTCAQRRSISLLPEGSKFKWSRVNIIQLHRGSVCSVSFYLSLPHRYARPFSRHMRR